MAMSRRPRTLLVGNTRWRVLWSRKSVLAWLEPGEDAGGICREYNRTIAVTPLLYASNFEREVLLHEVLRACFVKASIADIMSATGLSIDVEELLVGTITGRLLGALRDNPRLVSYLWEP
jgi:hypothetical protein